MGELTKVIETQNELLNYIINKAIEYYPCFLINGKQHHIEYLNRIEFNDVIRINKDEMLVLLNLIKNDKVLSLLLTEHTSSLSLNRLEFDFENSDVVRCNIIDFLRRFLFTSFQNCCLRLNYDINSFIDDVINQYKNLERCANKETINFSYFICVSGLRLEEVNEYPLSQNITIKNINQLNNPCLKNTITIGSTDKYKSITVGSIIELKTQTLSHGNTNNNPMERIIYHKEVDDFVGVFNTAVIIALNTIYPAVKFTFFYNDKPLNQNYFNDFTEYKDLSALSILSNSQLSLIQDWYTFLSQIDLNKIELTLHRLKSAIFNRKHPIDSILDAFICWESMFSSDIKTTKSVVNSISIILTRANYQISKKKLNELYNLRSTIVHGNPNEHKLIKSKNPKNPYDEKEDIKKQVIDIAIVTLRELIRDNKLLVLTPKERVEYLLNTEIEVCPICETKSYIQK